MIGLLRAAIDRGATVRTQSRGTQLLMSEGRVTGVRLATPDGIEDVAAKSVILATGGFEYDAGLRRSFLRGPVSRPVGVSTNTGDGLRMAMRAGADLSNMPEAWWTPVIGFPGTRADGGPNGLLAVRERALPGTLMVNSLGLRFCNEAANYNVLGGAFHQFDAATLKYENIPAYWIFTQSVVDKFSVFGLKPGSEMPEWVTQAEDLPQLADRLGLSSEALTATVTGFNEQAARGVDEAFGRGASAYDRWFGDRTRPDGTRRTLAPLGNGPFYAAEVGCSVLGTKGGPKTDVDGRVLDVDGHVIEGLFAAGNAMASPSGMAYGGAGSTLAVAGVWGMLSGKAAAACARASAV